MILLTILNIMARILYSKQLVLIVLRDK